MSASHSIPFIEPTLRQWIDIGIECAGAIVADLTAIATVDAALAAIGFGAFAACIDAIETANWD